jgi:hypothetical protein
MSYTLSTAVTQGITLSVNPTTITGSGSVTASTGVAVTGPATGNVPATGWSLTNQGTVTASAVGAEGVSLAGGGSIGNSGVIAGYQNGVDVTFGAATITNTGTIDSSPTKIVSGTPNNLYDGIYLADGGSVTNSGQGSIFGGISGIDIAGGTGTVSNTGTILTTTLQGNGVALEAGGTVTNGAGGSLYGDFSGISVYGGAGFVTNGGAIGAVGLNGYGVYLAAGGTVTNTGSITGSYVGVSTAAGSTATVTNANYIYGAEAGIKSLGGGLVTNLAGALVLSVTTAVTMDGGTVDNAGTIEASSATGTAVSFAAGEANDLVVEAGAEFIGAVTGGGAGSVLTLGTESVGAMGTVSGIGSQITGFDTITFDSGQTWSLAGTLSAFNGDVVTGFALGDTIVLDGVTGLSTSFDAGTGVLSLTEGGTTNTLHFEGALPGVLDVLDPADTMITLVPCFATGTRIATPQGEVAVETLRPGNEVLTVMGEALPIIWVGQRLIDCASHPEPERVRPICIQAHAFAQGAPHRDLLLSPDHAILAQGVLIPAKQLVNGTTIRQLDSLTVTYHHIELPRHAVIISEGLPTESYLDTGDRTSLGIGQAVPRERHALGLQGPEAQLIRDALACAPIRIVGPEVEQVRRRLGTRAGNATVFAEGRAA